MTTALRFTSLDVRRMPGFPNGLPELADLSPEATIVFGPNASGKTTLARALTALLWPHEKTFDRYAIRGGFDYDGSRWTIDLDAGRTTVLRDGRPADHPVAASYEIADRYRLGLVDLMRSDGTRFAEAVRRETLGGYDIRAAAANLGLIDKKPAGRSEAQALKKAEEVALSSRKEQAAVFALRRELEQLAEDISRAQSAAAEAELLRRALDYKAALSAFQEAEQRFAAYSPMAEHLSGRELERLKEVKTVLQREESALEQAELGAGKAAAALARIGVAELTELHVAELSSLVDDALAATNERNLLQRNMADATAQYAEEAKRLPEGVDEQAAAAIDFEAMRRLGRLSDKWESLDREIRSIAAEMDRLSPQEPPVDIDRLRDGVSLLAQLIMEPRTRPLFPAGSPQPIIVACLVIAAALALALLVDSLFVLLAAPAAALPAAMQFIMRPNPMWEQLRSEYLALGLHTTLHESMNEWSAEALRAAVAQLQRDIAKGEAVLVQVARRRELTAIVEGLQAQRDELFEDIEELKEAAGVDASREPAELLLLAESVSRLHKASSVRRGLAAALEENEAVLQEVLQSISETLTRFGKPEATDAPTARQAVRNLQAALDAKRSAEASKARHEDAAAGAKRNLERIRREYDVLFTAFGLTVGDEAGLHTLSEQRLPWQQARERLLSAKVRRDDLAGSLVDRQNLLHRSPEDMKAEVIRLDGLAESLRELSSREGEIKNRLAAAEADHNLERALAVRTDSRRALADAMERDAKRAVGVVLARALEEMQRGRTQTGVFRRVAQLFARITRGRFEAAFDPTEPTFEARDTLTNEIRKPDELSAGTRLQLLLAVRTAFVEEYEQGPRLPLLLDETLAVSDDERAFAVMDAMENICDGGRQLLYFTAQDDETAKWSRFFNERGRDFTVIDLGALTAADNARRLPLRIEAQPFMPNIPSPDGDDHAGYGARLNAPAIDSAQGLGGAHIWWFFDDPKTVYRLLMTGVSDWGRYNALQRQDGLPSFVTDAEKQRAAALERIFSSLASGKRIGKNKPVDGQAIREGGVSDTYFEKVLELAEQVEYDAQRLLTALRNKQVKRFRAKDIDALEQSLIDNGYLDRRTPLSEEELLAKATAAAMADLETNIVSQGDIRACLTGIV